MRADESRRMSRVEMDESGRESSLSRTDKRRRRNELSRSVKLCLGR